MKKHEQSTGAALLSSFYSEIATNYVRHNYAKYKKGERFTVAIEIYKKSLMNKKGNSMYIKKGIYGTLMLERYD